MFKSLTSILSALLNMMHFVRTFSIMHTIEEVRNYGEIAYIKNIFEKGWWEDEYPSFYTLDPSLVISYRNCQKSLAYFSHLIGTISFVFFTKKRIKGEGMAQCSLKYAPVVLYVHLSILGTSIFLCFESGRKSKYHLLLANIIW